MLSRFVTSQLGKLSLAFLLRGRLIDYQLRASAGGRPKGGNVTSAGWRVTLCDPVRRVSSRSGEAVR